MKDKIYPFVNFGFLSTIIGKYKEDKTPNIEIEAKNSFVGI